MTTIAELKATQERRRQACVAVANWVRANPPPVEHEAAVLDSFCVQLCTAMTVCHLPVGARLARYTLGLHTFNRLAWSCNWSSYGMVSNEQARAFASDMVALLDWAERCCNEALGSRACWDAFDPRV